jgi:hypothetical protein
MQQIGENLRKPHANARGIRALPNDTKFSRTLHESNQVCFTQRYFRQTLHRELAPNELAVFFELNPRTVRKYLLPRPQDAQVPCRHQALDEMLDSELTTMIIQAFNNGKAMMRRRALELVCESYYAALTMGLLTTFIGRHLDAFQPAVLCLKRTHV